MSSSPPPLPGRAEVLLPFPPGHFYSPIVDPTDIQCREQRLWPATPPHWPGLDLNPAAQRDFLESTLPRFLPDFDYVRTAEETVASHQFYLANSQFSGLDALTLFAMLRKYGPRRMIEVGSGFSTLLTADVNNRFLQSSLDLVCIEPYPRDFLKQDVPGLNTMVEQKVENADTAIFDRLGPGDFLFIDSSHVAKTGSDVHHLYLSIIPRLKAGVIIHIHDIFLPYDYPRAWVIDENRSWNEQYLLHALLLFTDAFRVLFGCAYAYYCHPELVKPLFAGALVGGGSFWMVKTR